MSIRDKIKRRADELGLTAYAIARDAPRGPKGKRIVSDDHVKAYLNGVKDMTGQKLDAVCRVLGLELREVAK